MRIPILVLVPNTAPPPVNLDDLISSKESPWKSGDIQRDSLVHQLHHLHNLFVQEGCWLPGCGGPDSPVLPVHRNLVKIICLRHLGLLPVFLFR